MLGAGLGALLAQWLRTYALAAILTGIAAHGFAMLRKHQLEREEDASEPAWVSAAYWLCWVMLAVLLLLVCREWAD